MHNVHIALQQQLITSRLPSLDKHNIRLHPIKNKTHIALLSSSIDTHTQSHTLVLYHKLRTNCHFNGGVLLKHFKIKYESDVYSHSGVHVLILYTHIHGRRYSKLIHLLVHVHVHYMYTSVHVIEQCSLWPILGWS